MLITQEYFVTAMTRKAVDLEGLRRSFPGLDLRDVPAGALAPDSALALWKAIDALDHNGKAGSVSDPQAVKAALHLLERAGVPPPSEGGIIGGVGVLPEGGAWKRVAEAGDRSITERSGAHREAVEKTGIGRYYGDHSSFNEVVRAGDRPAIEETIKAATEGRWSLAGLAGTRVDLRSGSERASIQQSSCIGWVMEHVGAAYRAAGKGARFDLIAQKMKQAEMRGTVLCEELQKDGWKAVFYAPEVRRCEGDDQKMGAINMARARRTIWRSPVAGSRGVKVDDMVFNYQGVEPDQANQRKLAVLEASPFLVGVANGGMHTFVGHKGQVCDFHWTAAPDDPNAMTQTAVRQWPWDTGLYMVPPGYWQLG